MIKKKERLKEESIFLANQLQESLDEEYIELTRLIGKNSSDRTVLSTEELKLKEELLTVSKLTKEKILKIIRNEKKKIQLIQIPLYFISLIGFAILYNNIGKENALILLLLTFVSQIITSSYIVIYQKFIKKGQINETLFDKLDLIG